MEKVQKEVIEDMKLKLGMQKIKWEQKVKAKQDIENKFEKDTIIKAKEHL